MGYGIGYVPLRSLAVLLLRLAEPSPFILIRLSDIGYGWGARHHLLQQQERAVFAPSGRRGRS